MQDDQYEAPLYTSLLKHLKNGYAHLHLPAHRQGQALSALWEGLKQDLFKIDLTELPGLDNLNNPKGPIARAQSLAAGLYGAKRTFFLVNGTSVGLQAFLMALCCPGEKIIIPRDSHRSVLAGLVLSGADPVYLVSSMVEGFGIPEGPGEAQAAEALEACGEAKGVLTTYPNYYGIAADLKKLAETVHRAGKPLMADEAHAAHFPFHPSLPEGGLSCGADASVMSMHKMGGSLTQSSLLHLQGDFFDPGDVAAALACLQTSSPSYPLLVSLDLARHMLAEKGRQLLDSAVQKAGQVRESAGKIPGLKVLESSHLKKGCSLDPTRITISGAGLGLTGFQLSAMLFEKYGVNVEMADFTNIVLVIGVGATEKDCGRLVDGLKEISRERQAAARPMPAPPGPPALPPRQLTPRQAWFSGKGKVSLEGCAGLVCGEWVAVYPPGIPVIYPGEEFTPEIVEYLKWVKASGAPVVGPADPELKTVKVIG
ncbi:MAG: Arginine decarboxylase [Desulfotomaculum sp. 46_296]|nr:MAG: Arginine decarboxylase [Desulfotomaculum sp. 46_296]HAU32237.1 decarboxylase [Desulfotomaculum sp.]